MSLKERGNVSDEAVLKATGKVWEDWFTFLDEADCKKMEHKAIAKYVAEKGDVGGWWAQMISVEYERSRGMRKMNEKIGGFEVSVSKTIALPIGELYDVTHEWFKAQKVEIRKANTNKSIRITWTDGTNVVAHFWEKGDVKSQLVIQQEKLENKDAVEKQRSFWKSTIPKIVS